MSYSLEVANQTAVYGTPFDPADQEVAVVELSAVWCMPCIRAVPHLNEVQKKYPSVKILSIFACPVAKIKAAIPETDYVISQVSQDDFQNWLQVLGTSGIPHAAVFAKGKLVWAGHPGTAQFEETIAKLVKKD